MTGKITLTKAHVEARQRHRSRCGETMTKAYIRRYSDTGQVKAYVEWSDGSRTEGSPLGVHMTALLNRARANGLKVERETW